jgi:hypothetical protein
VTFRNALIARSRYFAPSRYVVPVAQACRAFAICRQAWVQALRALTGSHPLHPL